MAALRVSESLCASAVYRRMRQQRRAARRRRCARSMANMDGPLLGRTERGWGDGHDSGRATRTVCACGATRHGGGSVCCRLRATLSSVRRRVNRVCGVDAHLPVVPQASELAQCLLKRDARRFEQHTYVS